MNVFEEGPQSSLSTRHNKPYLLCSLQALSVVPVNNVKGTIVQFQTVGTFGLLRFSVGKAWNILFCWMKVAHLLFGELPVSPKLAHLIACWWLLMYFSDNHSNQESYISVKLA